MSSKKQKQMAVRELSEVGAVEQRCLQLPPERQARQVRHQNYTAVKHFLPSNGMLMNGITGGCVTTVFICIICLQTHNHFVKHDYAICTKLNIQQILLYL